MAGERNIAALAAKLEDSSLDVKQKGNVAVELRDNVEVWCQSPQYKEFLDTFIPVFFKILDSSPVFVSTSPEQRLRNCVLEILRRLPMTPSDIIEPYAAPIVDKLMTLVKVENEENAVLCMKSIMEFQRHQTKALADRVQPFLDLIQEMFKTMESVVNETFDNPSPAPAVPSTPGNHQYSQSPRPGSPAASIASLASELPGEQQQARPLLKGMQSFKVLAECPIIVVSLFQAYRSCVNKNVQLFVPLIKQVLMLQAKPQEKAHAEAKTQGKTFTGVSKDIMNRTAFGEFITAQVKTMSFLAYLLRVYSKQLSDFLPTLPDIVVRLLKDCPREKSGTRKELLVAIRHIINFNFRTIFLHKIDELLDERTLIGDGLTVYETMRPLAYSMLADLIHHLRESLSKEQIRRTVEVYTKNLHDSFPGTSFQTMSAKLLLNMAECIAKLEPKEDARYFLIMILNAIGDKFAAMNRQFKNAVKLSAQYSQPSIDAMPEDHMAEKDHPPDWDEIDIFSATPIKTSNPRERSTDPIADNKFLFKNLLHGLKNLFYQLRACNHPRVKEEMEMQNLPANWNEVSYGYNGEEVKVLIKLFHEGALVFRYYGIDRDSSEFQQLSPSELLGNQHMMAAEKEEKELLETLGAVFHYVDPATFHEIFHSEIPHMYEMMFEHSALMHIPQFLLASEATSSSFAGMLLQFLIERIDEVGTLDVKKASILLRLFKLSFMAVTLFHQVNEPVLLPHVSKIITKSIQLSTTAEEPTNYFLLLRSLFRSIGGGRFEHLYKEILPLLEMLLEVLNNLLMAASKPSERDLFVELSLTVPARLSNLLPHLSYLMRPLVVALGAGSELVGQGLRTLELCVDNLTADYLDPIMAPVIDELMAALWEHLKPNPYSHFHAHTTMRILGKLGGRNRKFLTEPPTLSFQPYTDDEASFDVRLIGSTKDRAFPAATGTNLAISKLMEQPKLPAAKKSDTFHKKQAYRLIVAQTKMLLGLDSLPDDFAQRIRLQANDVYEKKWDREHDLLGTSHRDTSLAKKAVQQDTLKRLLKACIFANTLPEIRAEASSFLQSLCRHFALLENGWALAGANHDHKPFDPTCGEGPIYIDNQAIIEAIGESLASDSKLVRETAEECVMYFKEAAAIIFGSPDKVESFPFFSHLATRFCHNCHAQEWFMKAGGTIGIEILINRLGLSKAWLVERQLDLVRALTFVMKDMPQDLTAKTRIKAQDLLERLLRQCNEGASKEDLNEPKSVLYQLTYTLVHDLSHTNKHVRYGTRTSLSTLSEVTGIPTHELVAPVKNQVLLPIFAKPLRALPFAVQIAYIDAITYCLKLENGILEFNDQLTRLLMESLALADAEDENLSPNKPQEQRNAESIINLRVACIRMLSTAQSQKEFSITPPNQSFLRIISVFFKALYSKNMELIEAANEGLKGVLATTNKLPKDVLQSGLRPILVNLQDPRKLSVEGLDGLARLLKLLTTYFKVEIGSRLLEHMKTIADTTTLQKTSFTLIDQNRSMRIVTAIFNVFHLLPPAAITFLPLLVKKVVELETALRRTHYSPFREPLLKYLNQYPKESREYFCPLLKDVDQGRFFAQLLQDPGSSGIREEVMSDTEAFIKAMSVEGSQKEKYVAYVNAIHVVHSICGHEASSTWLVDNANLRKALLEAAKLLETNLRQNEIDADLRLAVEQAGEYVIEIFITYLSHEPNNLDIFFELIDAVTSEKLKSTPSLFSFIYTQMISSTSIEYWRQIVTRCIDLYTSRNTSQRTKTFTFKYLVNPIFAMDIMRNWDTLFGSSKGTKLMDKGMNDLITHKLWGHHAITDPADETSQLGVDHSRMELLQLSTLLVKYHSSIVNDTRKVVIKFAWAYTQRLEDVITKHAAFVLVSFFIAIWDCPMRIVVQTYRDSLKAHQNEGRTLVMQSLELLAPVLKKRMMSTDNHKMPMWARIARKTLADETSNLQQLMSIFHFLVRHADLFYEAREPLAQIIVPALNKVAAPPNPSNDNKKMALNLINLVYQWEEMTWTNSSASSEHMSNSPQGVKRKADGTVSETPAKTYVANTQLRMVLIKYLVSFIAYLPERYPIPSLAVKEKDKKEVSTSLLHSASSSADVCKKGSQLLRDLLRTWKDLDLDPILTKKIEEILTTDRNPKEKAEAYSTRIINTLQMLKIIVNVKDDGWVLQRIAQLQRILERSIRTEHADSQAALHCSEENEDGTINLKSLLGRILEVMPESTVDDEGASEETPSTEFVSFLSNVAAEGLNNGNYVSAINILWTLCQKKPDEIDPHIQMVMKALQGKLAKDHLSSQIPTAGQPPLPQRPDSAQPQMEPHEVEILTGVVLKVIDLLAARMNQLSEQRRPYLSVLASLVERSQSHAVCMKILDLVETWVFKSSDPVPTLKEKTAVLTKMQTFEQRPDQTLLARYLNLVIRIYEDPKITRSELTVRMEHAFLIGTRAQDVEMRNRFLSIFDRSLSRTASSRISYVLTSQHWDTLAESYWLSQVIHLIVGSLEMNTPAQLHAEDFRGTPASWLVKDYSKDSRLDDVMVDDQLESLVASQRRFLTQISDVKVRDIFEPLANLQHTDSKLAHDVWVALFPLFWSALNKDDQTDLEKGMLQLMTKEYHGRQVDKRPNCIQTMLEAIVRTKPRVKFPPHIMKYLAKQYNAWYPSAVYMEECAITPLIDNMTVRESNLDALLEIYASLQEDDLFYGTWRRRSQYIETTAAVSYEQSGVWDKAQTLYEAAQIKARTGAMPYSAGEYMLWEDHWVVCAQKLQQWEILGEFAKHENFSDLYLESMYRHLDGWTNAENREQLDTTIRGLTDAPTPRRAFFQAFMSLLKFHNKTENPQDFNRVCDEAIQLSIRKWHQLPKRITNAHIPILQNFQQLVELHDASLISTSLSLTTQANLDTKSTELKLLLGTWRDRLPNFWDDINAWQDLVTWRQHIFQLINNVYLPLLGPQQGNNATGNSFAYRGFHETAWIINRFAHVARKHNLPDVCISQLSKIYTLPNIEIQEAFLKLREQAKCHYQNRSELSSGLDVINNTNLNYFTQQQKAEFYTLKGMFLAELDQKPEANDAFGSALYFDIKLPKAWAEWGRYNDNLFKSDPTDLDKAASAISCYLEAAGQFKNAKSRKLLGRILWLLSLDNSDHKLVNTFEEFKGETPVWYWITYIPQLLLGLSRPEAKVCRNILGRLAKTYPQALFSHLRVSREEYQTAKKLEEEKERKAKQAQAAGAQNSPAVKQSSPERPQTSGSGTGRPSTANGDAKENGATSNANGTATQNGEKKALATKTTDQTDTPKKSWDHVEEVSSILKTAFPLLALSLETMLDQIQKFFKCPPDEDAYRLIVALLNDGLTYVGRSPGYYAQEQKLPGSTEANITRFVQSMLPVHIRKAFEAEFVTIKPTMYEYIHRLRKWRNRFEEKLDRRPAVKELESYSQQLSDFKFVKFDEVEVPGQYLQHRDKNQDFIRIERFLPDVDQVRGTGLCYRRIKIRGHDGSIHPFAVQCPAARTSRREERILQLFRIFNVVLSKRKESRRRNLQFHLPLIVPITVTTRLIQDDSSYVNLQVVFEDYCRRNNINRDDPVLFNIEKLRALGSNLIQNPPPNHSNVDAIRQQNAERAATIRHETFVAIQDKYVPNTLLMDYFRATYPNFDDYWLFRRTFSYQLAALTFMTYVMFMNMRYPSKVTISRSTGKIWGNELVPALAVSKPLFHNPEPVPFRLTPNIQTFMGPLPTEGIFAPAIMTIARCLTEPEGELEMILSIFIRDEMHNWSVIQKRQLSEVSMRDGVALNTNQVHKRAMLLRNHPEARNLPANQTVVDLVAQAVDPKKLSMADPLWMPYL
ncbi:hypothetical protein EJ05DRAFT_457386 [Pseudovirgaria hyperparasitica]|uniref:Non-specific serine/threonine protein kinase n=1 Tax=Pseudovirgaria hyperparasitica TaxID=470096 RepID=A0A6A6VWI4_9PEZI|nr:uncharacterized protein EJ05DRAFT_457386 [Pseudovirgaria hyperparasitica]KAF2754000.1 hypothetical protein EJ05DRAFT_457386 [Pseudovirgaria hyperparasitica]